jgi:hypothetical protein
MVFLRSSVSATAIMVCIVSALLLSSPASAADPAGVQFTFFDVNAPDTDQVKGVRFPTIYGKGNTNLVGWDIPILAWSELDSLQGVHWAPWLISGNHIRGDMTGVTASAVNWHEGQDTGLNIGFLNLTNNVKGLNWAFVNVGQGYTVADVGLVNVSQKSNFQLSWVNVTQELDGLQIGLVNCAKNGFLPCFVLFNFSSK